MPEITEKKKNDGKEIFIAIGVVLLLLILYNIWKSSSTSTTSSSSGSASSSSSGSASTSSSGSASTYTPNPSYSPYSSYSSYSPYSPTPSPVPTTFWKSGNNGTVSCDQFCAGSLWGTSGWCVGGLDNLTKTNIFCDNNVSATNISCLCQPYSSPSSITESPSSSAYTTNFWAHGNNGTVNCQKFCRLNASTESTCVGGYDNTNKSPIGCTSNLSNAGISAATNISCYCSPANNNISTKNIILYKFVSSPSIKTYSPTSTDSKGYVIFSEGFCIQWGYGKNEVSQVVTFPLAFTQVFGAQISKSYCNKNTNNLTSYSCTYSDLKNINYYGDSTCDETGYYCYCGGITNDTSMAPLNTYITSITNTGMNIDTGLMSYNKSEYFWMAYGYYTIPSFAPSTFIYPSTSYSFPTSSTLSTTSSSSSVGWVTLLNGFTFQWGYGKNEVDTTGSGNPKITFSKTFTQVFGAQISKSNCNNNTSNLYQTCSGFWNRKCIGGNNNDTTMAPLHTYITSLSTKSMYVDTGYLSGNKSDYFWLAYGYISSLSTQSPTLSTSSYFYPSSLTSATSVSTSSKGWITLDVSSGFTIQWGYAKVESTTIVTINFTKSYSVLCGMQISKSNCNNNTDFGTGVDLNNTTNMAPLHTYVLSVSTTGFVVDTGLYSTKKAEYFWIAYGIV